MGSGKPRVLTADGRLKVRRLIEHALGDRCECEFAASAAEAWQKLSRDPFQLALCDVRMAGRSDLPLASEIASELPETATVLLAEFDDPELVEGGLRLGAEGYLVEPFHAGQLWFAASSALRQQRRRRAIAELHASRQEVVERLAQAIEKHDPGAGPHIRRVGLVSALLAERLGFHPESVALLRAAAPMHDIGKIATPNGVLHKREALTPSERTWMQAHTSVGHRILAESESELLKMAARIALTHHERFDGKGYPAGLSGDDIPFEGRIVAVADAFDALLRSQPHRPAFSLEETMRMIAAERGRRFDPAVVDALTDNLEAVVALRG